MSTIYPHILVAKNISSFSNVRTFDFTILVAFIAPISAHALQLFLALAVLPTQRKGLSVNANKIKKKSKKRFLIRVQRIVSNQTPVEGSPFKTPCQLKPLSGL